MSTSSGLTAAHQQQLASSAITDPIVIERGYTSIAPGAITDAQRLLGAAFSKTVLRQVLHSGALAFPLYRLGDQLPHTWVIRPDMPRLGGNGKPIKYEYPQGQGNILDVLPRYHAALGDPSIDIWITEGTKKADSLASAFDTTIVPISINGVWGWRGTNMTGGKTALADFASIAWNGRKVILAPDGDARTNPNVFAAIQHLGRFLIGRFGIADLQVCYLPQQTGAAKVGIDDYLAAGHTTDDLAAHLLTLAAIAQQTRTPIRLHPETGQQLYLPPGYTVQGQTMLHMDEQGKTRRLYSGFITVHETSQDIATQSHTVMVQWDGMGGQHGSVVIPHEALTDSKLFSARVGSNGAALGPYNLKLVMQHLVEFIQENRAALPHRVHADRLGLLEGGLVLPAGEGIGFAQPVRYTGVPTITIGHDLDVYTHAIRAMTIWDNAWAAWLVFGLSCAAPALARLRPRRNPVLYLAGASGSGKTTLLQFSTGIWGNPVRAPLRVEAGRTTPAGIFQTLEHLGGLPLFIDEAHTMPKPERLEQTAYSFANGQTYTRGSLERKAQGGEILRGTLFLAGEAIPEFKHAGSRLRILWADANLYSPLGAEARSPEGAARAHTLEQAWEKGAGIFGLALATAIWGDWDGFTAEMQSLANDPALEQLGAWREPLAAAATTLNIAFRLCGVTTVPQGFDAILDHWAAMLTSGHNETDPALDAWESLMVMLAQGRRMDDSEFDALNNIRIPANWEWIEADRGGGLLACRRAGEAFWRVLSNTPQMQERVGVAAVQLYGQTWIKRGLVLPGADKKCTDTMRVYGHGGASGVVRVLKVPEVLIMPPDP